MKYFCISLTLATAWAMAGCDFAIVKSYGTSMIVEIGRTPPWQG